MEPYRPYVDMVVVDMVDSGDPIDTLDQQIKTAMLSIPVVDVVIDGQRSPLMVGVAQTTASLYKCFSGQVRRIAYPEL